MLKNDGKIAPLHFILFYSLLCSLLNQMGRKKQQTHTHTYNDRKHNDTKKQNGLYKQRKLPRSNNSSDAILVSQFCEFRAFGTTLEPLQISSSIRRRNS